MPAEWPGAPLPGHGCAAYGSWQRSVRDGRFAACLSCYCLKKCGCDRPEPWPFERGRCTGCGATLRALFPAVFAGWRTTGSGRGAA